MTTKEPARYRVNTLSFIGGSLVGEGAVIPYDGIPGSNLEPVNAAAEEAKAKAGIRAVPGVPLMPMPPVVSAPPAAPVDWQTIARQHGWSPTPPPMAEPERQAQAPQPAPPSVPAQTAAPAKAAGPAQAGGAASKLNKSAGGASDI